MRTATHPPTERRERADRRAGAGHRRAALSRTGLVVGALFAVLALTPSLLPRPALLQGALCAAALLIGYGVGTLIGRLLPTRIDRQPVSLPRRWPLRVLLALALAAGVAALAGLAVAWQNEVRSFVEMPPVTGPDVGSFLLGLLGVTVALAATCAGVTALFRLLRGRIGGPLGAVVTFGIVLGVLSVAGAVGLGRFDAVMAERNGAPDAGVLAPTLATRSAGPGSPVAWDELGRHGAAFIGGGPDAAEIADVTGNAALEPIRVYVGQQAGGTLEERAALAVAELRRTGAFERELLVVATTTGSGWLEPQTVDAVEYLHGGDTAIVSLQYAHTPSWVSFVFDPDAPIAAARALFNAVEAEWQTLPEGTRPMLVSYGLSLGAHGSQAAFAGLPDLRDRTDGALFVGSPNGSRLWQELTSARDPGTPIWLPVLDDGAEVRWASSPADLASPAGAWAEPRVAYLQHATDPITWLNPELIWSAPDWLGDSRAADVSPAMRWIPGVTALQVLVDMLMGESVPARHGHNYGDVVFDAWAAVTGDGDLTPAAQDRIRGILATYPELSSSVE